MEDKKEEHKGKGRPNINSTFSNFNLDAPYSSDYKLSLQELYRVLAEENDGNENIKGYYNFCIDHVEEEKNTYGILNKLERMLFLDARLKKQDSPQECFDKLRLLKFIFDVEKKSSHRQKLLDTLPNKEIRILNTMIHPSLEKTGVPYENLDEADIGEFAAVMKVLKPYALQSKTFEQEIKAVHEMWLRLLASVDYEIIKGDFEKEYPEIILKRLESVLSEIKSPGLQKPKDGVFNTFYQMMLITKYKAALQDFLRMDYEYYHLPQPSEVFSIQYAADPFFEQQMSWDEFCQYFSKKPKSLASEEGRKIWSLILYKNNPSIEDIQQVDDKGYYFAVKDNHAENLAAFWKCNVFYKGMTAADWVIVVQELMCIRTEKPDALVYKKSMSAIIKELETAPVIAKVLLLNRLVNRKLFLFGTAGQLETKMKIIHCIIRLENAVFSFYDINTIAECHRYLYFKAATCLISKNDFLVNLCLLNAAVNKKLKAKHIAVRIAANFEGIFPCIAALELDKIIANSEITERYDIGTEFIKRITDFMSSNQISDFSDSKLDTFLWDKNYFIDLFKQSSELKKPDCGFQILANGIAEAILQHPHQMIRFVGKVPVKFYYGYSYTLSVEVQYDFTQKHFILCSYKVK